MLLAGRMNAAPEDFAYLCHWYHINVDECNSLAEL